MEGLTNKQRMFVAEYLKDKNATQAAIRAGYSKRNADKISSQLMGKTRVAAAVEKALEAQEKRTLVDADFVISGLVEVANRCRKGKLDSAGANRALELLGKHLELFTDKTKHDIAERLAVLLGNSWEKQEQEQGGGS